MKYLKAFFAIILVFMLLFPGQAASQGMDEFRTVLTNCNVIDCTGNPAMENMTIIIAGDKIASIREGKYRRSQQEDGVRIIDLEGGYVLPGLWNMHSHLSDLHPDVNNILGTEPVLPAAIRAGRNAMDALKRGFTSLRMTGERDYIDIAWRDAFKAGVFVGPRIFASGKIMTATEGNAWEAPWPVAVFVDGPYEMRKAMRENMKRGIDFVKLSSNRMEKDEIVEAIRIAHKAGLRVTADVDDPMARIAVEAGIDCIEHGTPLTDETIRLMAENGTFFDPTMACYLSTEYIADREARIAEIGLNEDPRVIAGRIAVSNADLRPYTNAVRQREILMKAVKAGVKIITGSDTNPLGEIGLLEIEQLVFSGMTEMQALIAATKNPADMMGRLDDLGTVEEGKIADLIVLGDNPLVHISNIRKLKMVFKEGKRVNLTNDEGQMSFWDLYFTKK
jgi:imidazolonepropionase-like amidohydrolase